MTSSARQRGGAIAARPLAAGGAARWRVGAHTLTGPGHECCQDALLALQTAAGGLHAALADGVSGGACGDVAAHAAVSHCTAFPAGAPDPAAALCDWLAGCDAAVAQAVAAQSPAPGAATLVAVWLDAEGRGYLAHVGDCRAYRWRPGVGLHCLTRDQSYRNLGLTPPPGISPDNPARMLGIGASDQAEVQPLHLQTSDTLILCSDGLHGVLDGDELAQLLVDGVGRREDILARHIAARARALGSQDDIGVLLARFPRMHTSR